MNINKTTLSLSFATLLLSQAAFATNCTNDPNEPLDGINLFLTASGLTNNTRALTGSLVTLKASSQWQSVSMFSTPLNVKLYLNDSLEHEATTTPPPDSSYIEVARSYNSLPRGVHQAKALTSNDSACNSIGSFIIQDEPTANANGNYTAILDSSNSSSLASINLTGDYSVDQQYSVNGSSPDVYWEVDGNSYDQPNVTVQLPHGNYVAKLTVRDGTYIATDTATITVSDSLNVKAVDFNPVCQSSGQARTFVSWTPESLSDVSYFNTEWKPEGGSWQHHSTTTTTGTSILPSGTAKLDGFRVQACSSYRCGEFHTNYYITQNCSGNHNYD